MVQIIKDINARIIEDPSLTKNIGGRPFSRDLSLFQPVIWSCPPWRKRMKLRRNQPPLKVLRRRKRKETAPPQDSMVRLEPTEDGGGICCYGGYFSSSYRHFGTDDELREAFEEVEKDKVLEELERVGDGSQEKSKTVEEEEEIPAEVIAESIALAQKQQEETKAELTSSELALFENPEAEQSTTSPPIEEQAEQPASELSLEASNCCCKCYCICLLYFHFCLVLTYAFLQMPIHSLPGSSATASFAEFEATAYSFPPELAEFEAMDLDAQLDKLEKLSSPPSKAKSRAVEEAMERLKIWQSSELELDEDREAFDQLMKDPDSPHSRTWPQDPFGR
ncbi:unnamed protein product [Prunus brigantina]